MIQAEGYKPAYGIVVAIGLILLLALSGVPQLLLSSNGFIPHGHCYLWKPGLVGLHVASDALIALAYISISASLAYLVYTTRREIPFHWMFLAFGIFIIACGTTHLVEVWTLWHPTYWLAGSIKIITAIASVTTAIALPPLIPQALTLVESAKLSEERRRHLETANQELEALYAKLKELDQLKTQFFANVSHELRTPLALILGPTERLLQTAELTQEQQRDLRVIDRNAHLLLKQVNDLLDVSKLEAGRMQVQYSMVDLTQLVRLTAANFDGLAQERQIDFTVETPAALQTQVDVEKIQRILLNLLSNAFKFTPDQGTIVLRLEQQSDYQEHFQIVVQDSGSGVPEALREAIFERFRQGESGTTRRFGGTGLGLAIVKELVELQGGTVAVEDAAIGGAQFTVTFPLSPVALSPVTAAKTATETPTAILPVTGTQSTSEVELDKLQDVAWSTVEELRGVTPSSLSDSSPSSLMRTHGMEKPLVLVVEDNLEMNQFISETLASDYRTATAADGREGLEQAIALHPDLILSDIMMPHLSGDQFVCQLRTHPELDTTPIVVLTAKTDDESRVDLLRRGVQDYLMKPFSIEELRLRVNNLISIKRTRELLQQELASQSHDIEALAEEVSLRRRELQIAMNGLQQQAEELTQANRLKDEFLAIVSHELRTPLNMILGWAQMLQTRNLSSVTITNALETIERNARLQAQLIENLLDISRLLRGRLLLDIRSVEMQPLIQTAIQSIKPIADEKSIELITDIDTSAKEVYGDPKRLQQIVENLLNNAVKFTPVGGRIDVQLSCPDRQACLRITDTGQGISAEAMPYIFDYFRQADSSITRTHGGLGLGLAIVRQLVELQNGSVVAESLGEGQGSTFTVTLPLAESSTSSGSLTQE